MPAIQSISTVSIKDFSKGQLPALRPGEIIQGRLVDNSQGEMNIILAGGMKAVPSLRGNLQLPLNQEIPFLILEYSDESLILKPITENAGFRDQLEQDMVIRTALALGIDPNQDNINMLSRLTFHLSTSIQRMIAILTVQGDNELLNRFSQLFVTIKQLPEYLKGYNHNMAAGILEKLGRLYNESGLLAESPTFQGILSDIINGFNLQINHPFPFFFVPLMIRDDDGIHTGELWVHKKNQNVILWVETDFLGPLKVQITNTPKGLFIQFNSARDKVDTLRSSRSILIKQLKKQDIYLSALRFEALTDEDSALFTLHQFVKPHSSVDLKT